MPHSGGGGSHGGGHHSGGHHGGSGGSSNRVSSTYFSGAHRYMYYYNNRPHYYYANRKVGSESKSAGIFMIIFAVMWLAFSLPVIVLLFTQSIFITPLKTNYDTTITIDDEIGIVDNQSALNDTFREFQDKTGVTLCVVTRSPENRYMGNTYVNQAYNCYVSRWDDESHWLIYYVGEKLDRTDDWHFELMCGDDCTKILSSSVEDKFTNDFHRYLVSSERYTFSEAIKTALDNIDVKPGSVDTEALLMSIIMLIFPIVGVCIFIGGIATLKKAGQPEEKAKETAIEIDAQATYQEVVCDYCSGVYLRHTCLNCPHCGAPVKVIPENEN